MKRMNAAMIEIDGAQGEGGGQILRSALTLALMTDRHFRILNIRARRSKPGLRPQHLASVNAAASVGQAQVEGAHLGSREIEFHPSSIHPGSYRFEIPTAGSTSLVLQTVLLPLSAADSPSEIVIMGGTHVPWSPSFHYLEANWLRAMRLQGFRADLTLEKAGFYPQGGGRIGATIQPLKKRVAPLRRLQRGDLQRIRGLSFVSNLPESIAQRQRKRAVKRLADLDCPVEIEVQTLPSPGKGSLILLHAEFETGQACYFGLGARGKPAERVADEAVDALDTFLGGEGVVDEYLADQLLLPLAFADGDSEFRTSKITQHLLTNAEVIRAFGAAEIDVRGELDLPGVVEIRPRGNR
ncbi:MAG: RNA 3'-terminal phosphate cyclase [Chloroflexota bacterium]|nr:RNA 3'-terminal phosphate cyclase [Chloroflexota bacterium]